MPSIRLLSARLGAPLFLAVIFCACAANLPKDMEDHKPLQVDRKFLDTRYLQDGGPVKPLSLFPVFERYPEANAYVPAAKAYVYTGFGLGLAGGFMIGYPLGYLITGHKLNVPMLTAGMATSCVALIFDGLGASKLSQAAAAYNAALAKTGFRLDAGPQSLGLAWNASW